MKNIKVIVSSVVMCGLLFAVSSSVYALEVGVDVGLTGSTSAGNKGASTSAEVRAEASVTAPNDDKKSDNATNTNKGSEASSVRSSVATFVEGLLDVADRDGGIGAEVRTIAMEQNESGSTTAEAMAELDQRSTLKTFLVGTDYKNVGVIRSGIAKTEKQIERLKTLADSTTDATAKAELNLQIQKMEQNKADVEAFVETHENAFSLFGWFVRIFTDVEAEA